MATLGAWGGGDTLSNMTVVTFGSPRVGNKEWASAYNKVRAVPRVLCLVAGSASRGADVRVALCACRGRRTALVVIACP